MTSNAEYEISKLLWNNFFHEDRISLSDANISKDWGAEHFTFGSKVDNYLFITRMLPILLNLFLAIE